MDNFIYELPLYGILALSVLVMAIPKWFITGRIVAIFTLINLVFIDEIEIFAGDNLGATFLVFDAIIIIYLFFKSDGESVPLWMCVILFFFSAAHFGLQLSMYAHVYSFFWREYVNIIFSLNLLQLSYLSWGFWSGVRSNQIDFNIKGKSTHYVVQRHNSTVGVDNICDDVVGNKKGARK